MARKTDFGSTQSKHFDVTRCKGLAKSEMTLEENEICKAFGRITFLPGSYDKRFCKMVNWMAGVVNAGIDTKNLLTEKQHNLIYAMLHRYRRQIPDVHEKYCKECKNEVQKETSRN